MMEERVKYFLKSNSVEENIAGYYILTKLLTLNPNHEINHNFLDSIFISRMLVSSDNHSEDNNEKTSMNIGRITAINFLSTYLTHSKSSSTNDTYFELFCDNDFILLKTLLNTTHMFIKKNEILGSDSEAVLHLIGETLSNERLEMYIQILLRLLPITLFKPFSGSKSNGITSSDPLMDENIPNKIEERAFIFLNVLNEIATGCPSHSLPLLKLESDDMRKHLRDLFVICLKSSHSTIKLQSETLNILNGFFDKFDIAFTLERDDVNDSRSKGHGTFATLIFSSTIAEIHSLSALMTNYVENTVDNLNNNSIDSDNDIVDLTSDDFQMKWFTCCDLLDKFLSFLVDDGLENLLPSKEEDDDRCGIWGNQLPSEVILNFKSILQRLSESTMYEVNKSLRKLNEFDGHIRDKNIKEVWEILVIRMAESLSFYGMSSSC